MAIVRYETPIKSSPNFCYMNLFRTFLFLFLFLLNRIETVSNEKVLPSEKTLFILAHPDDEIMFMVVE